MRYLLVAISILALSLSAFSEGSKIDSLRSVADTTSIDSNKAKALDKLTWQYIAEKQIDEAIDVAYEQVSAARKSKNPRIISMAFYALGTHKSKKAHAYQRCR